ncbi:MAG TPA: AI-2E family transporter [Thiolapillus brandeum]|uniref:AI-2E family transporter n=1 Tax=Thiolapillus brandeum TaxID=1076588 RepID=A0A831RYK1_9GAMM|nr:AI-2E family transporter [Thiolapillus brandeum]
MNDKPEEKTDPIDSAIQIGLMALLTGWSIYIASPFIGPIIWGIIIAIGSYPLYSWLHKKFGLGKNLTATLLTLLMLAVLIIPSVMLSGALVEEARELSGYLQEGNELSIPPPPDRITNWPLVGKKLHAFWVYASENPGEALGEIEPQLKTVGKWLLSAAAGTGLGILMFIFSIIIAGIFLATAAGGRKAAVAIFDRLTGDRGEELTELSKSTVRSVVNGILGIAIIQTLLAGLGFLAMGIPGAGILALVCLVLAVVQIDILLILIPLSIYAFSFAGTGAAIAFLAWNIAVGLMNNVLKPILLARGVKAPMAVIFVGAIGGLIAHGLVGLFVGAVVLVLAYTLFMLWLDERTVPQDA